MPRRGCIESNMALARRIVGGVEVAPDADAPAARGPVEDAWLTWADSAGDLVTVSYLTAQLADVLGVFSRPSSKGPDARA